MRQGRFRSFTSELRRRKVGQVAALYVAAAAGAIALASDVVPAVSLPERAVTLVVVLALVGFPIAIALAWAYDITWGGVERTAPGIVAENIEAVAERSIVVLPFDNLSPDPENAYFTDGLTDELIADLSLVRSLRVISRTSAMQLKGTDKDLRAIGRELGVRYVLEGSVRRAGADLRITAQLIEAERDAHLWTEKYSGTLEDVFDIQEKVSRAIVDALRVELSPGEERRLAARPVNDLAAYECYLKARHQLWLMSEASLDEALRLLDRGLELLSESALLHATRGIVFCQYINTMSKSPAEYTAFIEQARGCAGQALALDPSCPTALYLRGWLQYLGGSFAEGLALWRRAVEINPNDSDTLNFLAFGLMAGGGNVDLARRLIDRAVTLDPLNPLHTEAGRSYFPWYAGDFRAVLDLWVEWRRLSERVPFLRLMVAYFNAAAGHAAEARRIVERMAREMPHHPSTAMGLFLTRGLNGERDRALAAVTEVLEQAAWWDDYFAVLMADGYALVGENERACHWVERAMQLGTTNAAFLGEHEPFLRRLGGDPAFEALLGKARALSDSLMERAGFGDGDAWFEALGGDSA